MAWLHMSPHTSNQHCVFCVRRENCGLGHVAVEQRKRSAAAALAQAHIGIPRICVATSMPSALDGQVMVAIEFVFGCRALRYEQGRIADMRQWFRPRFCYFGWSHSRSPTLAPQSHIHAGVKVMGRRCPRHFVPYAQAPASAPHNPSPQHRSDM